MRQLKLLVILTACVLSGPLSSVGHAALAGNQSESVTIAFDSKFPQQAFVPNITSFEPTAGGVILEAENAQITKGQVVNAAPGFTGTGYVDFDKATEGGCSIEWTFEALVSGVYTLEFRYALPEGQRPVKVSVNGQAQGDVVFWTTSSNRVWAWDRKTVTLKQGSNPIKLTAVDAMPHIDHLNILFAGKTQ